MIMKRLGIISIVAITLGVAANISLADDVNNSGASATVNDSYLTTKAKAKLATTSNIPSHSIQVETNQGVATLTGKVHSPDEKQRAEDTVRSVDGVTTVNNHLAVVPKQ